MPTRRMLVVVLFTSLMTSLFLFSFIRPPPLPIPEGWRLNSDDWLEFGDDGQCLFLSPLAELDPLEREAALASMPPSSPSGVVAFDVQGSSSSEKKKGKAYPVNPILGLLAEGERQWADLLDRQSRSLGEAVAEYRKRHKMEPPRGFDVWWDFATANGVLLPDEYDPILESLRPFFALPPDEVGRRVAEAEQVPETYTLIVNEGGRVILQWNDRYSREKWVSSRPRSDHQINVMEPFVDDLTEMRVTISIHDVPMMVLPHERKEELNGLSERKGAYTETLDEPDLHTIDWLASCPSNSPARTGVASFSSSPQINFISSHMASMDPCENPSLFESHAHFLSPPTAHSQPKPHSRLLPILGLSRTLLHADVPVPPVGVVPGGTSREDVGREPQGGWDAKIGKLYWRGLPSVHTRTPLTKEIWKKSHRTRIHSLGQSNSSTTMHPLLLPTSSRDGSFKVGEWSEKELRDWYLDVQLEGTWTCADGNNECKRHAKLFANGPRDNSHRSNDFKYVLDTDSESFSKRFPKLMAAKNLVFKAGVFPEWNQASLPAWFAYVPVNVDYSDLFSILAFFRGHPENGRGIHDRVARRIASNGQCWVERTWRKEDMQAYAFRLYLEYARVVHPDRDTGIMDYEPNQAPLPPRPKPEVVLKKAARPPRPAGEVVGGVLER